MREFDPEKGFRFSTICDLVDQAGCAEGRGGQGRTIRVPVHMGERIRKVTRTYNELSAKLGRQPTDEEVAEWLGWAMDKVRDVKDAMTEITSLNGPLGAEGDGSELGDLVEDECAADTAGEVIREMERSFLQEAIERLPERHRYVLVRRYGLATGVPPPSPSLAESSRSRESGSGNSNERPSICSRAGC